MGNLHIRKITLALILLSVLSSCGNDVTGQSSVDTNNSSHSSFVETEQSNSHVYDIYTDEEFAYMIEMSQLIIDNGLTFTIPIEQAEKGALVNAFLADGSFYDGDTSAVPLEELKDILAVYVSTDDLDENIAFNFTDNYDSDSKTLSATGHTSVSLQSELVSTTTDITAAGNDVVTFVFSVYDNVLKETEISFIKVDGYWKIRSGSIHIKTTLDIESLATAGFDIGGENVLYKYAGTETVVEIPVDILSVGAFAFYGRDDVTAVTIPHTVTNIDDKAFASCGLTSVTIPASVQSIGTLAFANYNPETDNSSLVAIVSGVEISSSLATVVLEEGVKSVGYRAFADCGLLTSITIPPSVIDMADDIFKGCASLAVITVKEGSVAESYAKDNGFEVEYY